MGAGGKGACGRPSSRSGHPQGSRGAPASPEPKEGRLPAFLPPPLGEGQGPPPAPKPAPRTGRRHAGQSPRRQCAGGRDGFLTSPVTRLKIRGPPCFLPTRNFRTGSASLTPHHAPRGSPAASRAAGPRSGLGLIVGADGRQRETRGASDNYKEIRPSGVIKQRPRADHSAAASVPTPPPPFPQDCKINYPVKSAEVELWKQLNRN